MSAPAPTVTFLVRQRAALGNKFLEAMRYSTEVVLARFRGELTLLGDARGNGNANDGRPVERRSEPEMVGASGGGMGGFSSRPELDDDIPFAPCWQ